MVREDYQQTLIELSNIANRLDEQAVKNNDGHARYIYTGVTRLICDIKDYIKTAENIEWRLND